MKQFWRIIERYYPWLLLLLGVDCFCSIILWISDIQAFQTLIGLVVLTSNLLFSAILFVLNKRETTRRELFRDFLSDPTICNRERLLSAISREEGESIQLLASVLQEHKTESNSMADAIQETILKCYEKLSTLKKDSYFKTWMIRILINNCNEMLRHKGRVFPTMEMEEGIFEESGYVDCEWKEILASLDEKYQVVMLLYYSKSLSVKEIAALLEISQNTVLTRLSRARKQLRAEYEGGYIHG